MDISNRLREMAKDFGSISLFAEALGMKQASFQSYINTKNGKISKPGFDLLKKIHDLGYNVEYLLTGDGPLKKSGDTLEALADRLRKRNSELEKENNDLKTQIKAFTIAFEAMNAGGGSRKGRSFPSFVLNDATVDYKA